jgi:hypothetical protein
VDPGGGRRIRSGTGFDEHTGLAITRAVVHGSAAARASSRSIRSARP